MTIRHKPIPMGFDADVDPTLRQDLWAAREADGGYDVDAGLDRLRTALVATGAAAAASASVKAAASSHVAGAGAVSTPPVGGVVTASGVAAKSTGASIAAKAITGAGLWGAGAKFLAGGIAGAATVATVVAVQSTTLLPLEARQEELSSRIVPEPLKQAETVKIPVISPADLQEEPAEAPTPEVDRATDEETTPEKPRQRRRAGKPKDAKLAARQEMKDLARARSALASDPSAALRILRGGSRQYAGGLLGEEREALSVVALSRIGHHREAQRRATAFLRKYPGSTFTRTVEAVRTKASNPGAR